MKSKEDSGWEQCVFTLAALTSHRIMGWHRLRKTGGRHRCQIRILYLMIGNFRALGAGRLPFCKDLLGKQKFILPHSFKSKQSNENKEMQKLIFVLVSKHWPLLCAVALCEYIIHSWIHTRI